MLKDKRIAVIGLGYVGLPLAVEFGRKYPTIGFEIDKNRKDELNNGVDNTLEVSSDELKSVLSTDFGNVNGLFITTDESHLESANVYIVTVPTPIDDYNNPVLKPLEKASTNIGRFLKKGDIVIYESTVFPGATEQNCVPILERESGLRYNKDFFAGYSPERINPGDKNHTITKILKVTSGSTPETATTVDELYKSIITAGTFKASSIKVAEAAKVIENSQRDINIAFVNELSKIFNIMGIDTSEVLEAAGTKWNFLPFKPGLVGGHCIGVDPYYLAQKAQEVGYHPEIILSGRRLNDSMGSYVVSQVIKLMIRRNIQVKNAKALILGITFKENCPDIRNTRVIDIYRELESYDVDVDIYDPWANKEEVNNEYGVQIHKTEEDFRSNKYNVVILAVAHEKFKVLDMENLRHEKSILYDVKSVLPKDQVDGRL